MENHLLKDVFGLGLVLFIIASTQLGGFVLG